MYKSLLLALAALSISSTAFAQGELYADVSRTNYSDKSVNIRVSPLATFVGIAQANLMFSVTDRLNLGVSGGYLFNQRPLRNAVERSEGTTSDISEFDFAYSEIGLRADYGITGSMMADTFYVSGVLRSLSVEVKDTLFNESARADIIAAGAMGGYQWMWDNININLGLGLLTPLQEEYDTSNVDDVDDEDLEGLGTLAAFEFNIGVAF